MFDALVNALVRRFAPFLEQIGEAICSGTPGVSARWPTYDFMCRNTEKLAEQSLEHVILTVVAMLLAILLGVLIGVRVSSAPWPQRNSILLWPVIVLLLGFLIVGAVALAIRPEALSEVEAFQPADPSTWSEVTAAMPDSGTFGLLIIIQSVLVFGLAAVLVAGIIPGGSDLRILGAALAGAILGPLLIPRPVLHTLLLQVYRLARGAGLSGDSLDGLAGALNWVRDAAPFWALIAFVLMLGSFTKKFTWRNIVGALLGGYALTAILGVFVIRPGESSSLLLIQLLLFAVFAMLTVLGEKSADPALYVAGIIFTIPSLAMFGIMIPIIGIGVDPAIAALALYALLPILRNTITAMREIDPSIIEAGRGMGMTDLQLLTRVQLPLALPVILAGVRVSTVMTVGIASIATLIGAGGLGELVFHGINRTHTRMVLTGAIWIALLALLFDFVLGQGEIRWVSKGIRPDKGDQSDHGDRVDRTKAASV